MDRSEIINDSPHTGVPPMSTSPSPSCPGQPQDTIGTSCPCCGRNKISSSCLGRRAMSVAVSVNRDILEHVRGVFYGGMKIRVCETCSKHGRAAVRKAHQDHPECIHFHPDSENDKYKSMIVKEPIPCGENKALVSLFNDVIKYS